MTTSLSRFLPRPVSGSRLLSATAAVAGLLFLSTGHAGQQPQQPPAPVVQNGWAYTTEALATGVNNGYQLAMDPVNRRVYFTDARWRAEDRAGDQVWIRNSGAGKLVEFDVATRSLTRIHSFLGLTRNDGRGKEGEPLDWTGVEGNSASSARSTFSPYGIAVDPLAPGADGRPDPIIVTTTARGRDLDEGYGGNVVIYRASQGAPTDADRLFEFEDGTPIFSGIRRVAVNPRTHKVFITGMGSEKAPGGIVIVDLPTKRVDARVTIPGGATGVDVDVENNLIYVGTMQGEKLYVIDGGKIDTSNPKNGDLNKAAVTELPAVVGGNARPTYNAQLKRVYVAAFGRPAGSIHVVDADRASRTYGQLLHTIQTGATNMVEVDAERGLIFSANLGDKEVVAFDAKTHQEQFRLPTSGNALNIAIDPVTRDVWVSNFGSVAFVNIFQINRVK